MTKVNVHFTTPEQIKLFVNTVSRFDCEFDMESGRYVVDAKSILGVLSLDPAKPTTLVIQSDDQAEISSVLEAIKDYITE